MPPLVPSNAAKVTACPTACPVLGIARSKSLVYSPSSTKCSPNCLAIFSLACLLVAALAPGIIPVNRDSFFATPLTKLLESLDCILVEARLPLTALPAIPPVIIVAISRGIEKEATALNISSHIAVS